MYYSELEEVLHIIYKYNNTIHRANNIITVLEVLCKDRYMNDYITHYSRYNEISNTQLPQYIKNKLIIFNGSKIQFTRSD
jgi:hypothetical protein